MRRIRVSGILLAAISLSGCVIPDRYEAELTLGKDLAYTESIKGEATNPMILAGLAADARKGITTPPDRVVQSGKQFADRINAEIMKRKGQGELVYVKDAHYKMDVRMSGSLTPVPANKKTKKQLFLGLLSVTQAPDGMITITTPELNAKARGDLKGMGVTSKGNVCIKTDLEVVDHNADKTPGLFSSCYGWNLDIVDGKPLRIVLRR